MLVDSTGSGACVESRRTSYAFFSWRTTRFQPNYPAASASHLQHYSWTQSVNNNNETLSIMSWNNSTFGKRQDHHTTTVLRPFFRDYPGEPVPEENFWTLWCKGRLTEADTQTIRLGATPSGLTSAHLHHPPIFYRLDALPAAQPPVSKHWRQDQYDAY